MIKTTIEKIETAIREMGSADPKKKDELLRLLAVLKSEVQQLSKTHGELQGLASSVRGFEATHPDLVRTVDELCRILAGIGI